MYAFYIVIIIAIGLSQGLNQCSPCFCYPEMSPPTFLLCNGRDIIKYPTLATGLTKTLKEIHIGETMISCLPSLDSADWYASLNVFSESLNDRWNCSCLEMWMSTLAHAHFTTSCPLGPTTSEAATSVIHTDYSSADSSQTAPPTHSPSPSQTDPPSSPSRGAVPSGPSTAGSPPPPSPTGSTGAPTDRTTARGDKGEESTEGRGGPDAGDIDTGRQLAVQIGAAAAGVLLTSVTVAAGASVARRCGSRGRNAYNSRGGLCACWRKVCYSPCCRKLRHQRTTPLEFTDFTYINEGYLSSSV